MFEFFSLNRTYRILQGLDTAAPGIICRIIEEETITFLFDIFFAFFPLFPHTPRLSVVKHVVKNRFLNTLVTGDRKRLFLWPAGVLRTNDSSLRFAALYL